MHRAELRKSHNIANLHEYSMRITLHDNELMGKDNFYKQTCFEDDTIPSVTQLKNQTNSSRHHTDASRLSKPNITSQHHNSIYINIILQPCDCHNRFVNSQTSWSQLNRANQLNFYKHVHPPRIKTWWQYSSCVISTWGKAFLLSSSDTKIGIEDQDCLLDDITETVIHKL